MFKENKYTNLYNKLIERSVERNWKKASGRERHHIIPQSLGGSNDKSNLTYLSAREHFICHWLLIKMTEGDSRSKMLYALMGMRAMSENHQRYSSSVTSRVYEKYRIEHALNHSTTMKQKNLVPWNKGGVEITDEHRANLVQAARNRKIDPIKQAEGQLKRIAKVTGLKRTDETRKKMSLSHIGLIKGPQSADHRKAISESIKGKPKKEGHSDNVRNATLGNISINKDGAEKKVKRDTLDQWLSDGWQLGGKKRIR
jgi:hypothetical protein